MFEEVVKKFNIDSSVEVKVVRRTDFLTDSCGKMSKTDEGYLTGTAPIAKTGVMVYLMADGTIVREYVPKETLFHKDSMSSLKMKPMTNTHPSEKRVNADNAGWRQVGFTGETVCEDSGKLVCSMTITDGSCINDVANGRQELSPGYEAEVVYQKGKTDDGEEYDAIQVSRKYNHVAVVDNARGGTDIRMKLDGKEADIFDKVDNVETNPKKEQKMKFTIDGKEYELDSAVVAHLSKLSSDLNAATAATKTANDELQRVTAERDTFKVKNDSFEKRDFQKELNDAVQVRLGLERLASTVLDSVDEKLDNANLKKAIITKKLPEIAKKLDDKTSPVYVDAIIDSIVEGLTKTEKDGLAAQRGVSTAKVDAQDTKTDGVTDARKNMADKMANAWKNDSSTEKK